MPRLARESPSEAGAVVAIRGVRNVEYRAGLRVNANRRPEDVNDTGNWPNPWQYAGLGTELVAGVAGFVLLGYWIDWKYGTRPVALIVGSFLGVVGGLYHFIRKAVELQRKTEKAARKQHQHDADHERDQSQP